MARSFPTRTCLSCKELEELEEASLPLVEQVEVKGEYEVTPEQVEELAALPVDFDFDAASWQMP